MITATATLGGSITATAQLQSQQTGSCPNNETTVNTVAYATAPSGTPIDVDVENTANAGVGALVGGKWQIDDSQAQVNGVNTETIPATVTHDQQIHDSAGSDVGTAANPSVVSDTTIRNQANDWSDTEVAQGTFTLPYLRVVDSDGSNNDTVDYKPVADGAAFTCTPADYGTRILSVLRREYCMGALCGFSLVYIEDEFASNGSAVIRVRRSSDNAEQDFTPTEITDGTLTTFTGAGDGFIVKFYDQTRNYFELFNTSAAQQAKLVDTGVLNTDTQGNAVAITTSTNGYEIGANGSNSSRLTLFSPNGAFWMVGTKNNSTSISRAISAAGNPAVGIADTTSNPNDVNTGTPNTYVNGSALADQNRDTLQTAINNVEHILLMTNCEWTDSGNWRTSQGILAFQAYPVGSQISEFVLGKMDWDTVTLRNLIFTDRNSYYGYY